MKKYCYLLGSLVLIFTSCKERIEVPLNENIDKLVIEGEVHDGVGPYYVKVSRSSAFSSGVAFVPHSPNSIVISDNEGNVDSLVKYADGIYQTNTLKGKVGNTYYLTVNDNSGTYTAQSTLNSSPTIDSFYFYSFLSKDNINPTIVIQEPRNVENYYRYYTRKNNNAAEFQYTTDDKLIDGSEWRFSTFREDFKSNDSGEFFLLGIDRANWKYWSILIQNQAAEANGNENAAPVNPPTNIAGGEVLGYFSAHSMQSVKFLVP